MSRQSHECKTTSYTNGQMGNKKEWGKKITEKKPKVKYARGDTDIFMAEPMKSSSSTSGLF